MKFADFQDGVLVGVQPVKLSQKFQKTRQMTDDDEILAIEEESTAFAQPWRDKT